MEKNSPLLKADQLHKTFGRPASLTILKGISLEVYPGQSVAIMGGSGQGKSTLLHILGTLEAPSKGDLWIAGKKTSPKPSASAALRHQHIGFVFQNFHLLEEETALQNVLLPALISGHSITKQSPAYTRALNLLDQVGLSHRANFLVKLLSGGEKQRVALARALCNDPDLLMADEPSGNLDRQTAAKIHELLLSFVKDLGKGLIVVTHDADLAHLCDAVYCLQDGLIEKVR